MIYEIKLDEEVYDIKNCVFGDEITIDTKKIVNIRTYREDTPDGLQILGLKINGECIPLTYICVRNLDEIENIEELEELECPVTRIYKEIVEIMKKESE